MNVMPHRVRLITLFVGLLVLVVAPGVQASRAAAPTLTLNVNLSGSLEVVLGNGTVLRTTTAPGAVIPPGPYLVLVKSDVPDSRDIFHLFHLSGTGVNVSSDLLPCENPRQLLTITLLPSSTYTYEDSRHTELTPIVFSTSSGGSSSDTSSNATAGPANVKSSASSSNTSVVGSDGKASPFRGTLVGTVSLAGKLTLSRNGKSVSSLRSGRYKIAVDDRTPKSGFVIAGLHRQSFLVTGSSFVGKHTLTLVLNPGQWMFYSSTARKHRFTVVA
jgi:hypothetical protein